MRERRFSLILAAVLLIVTMVFMFGCAKKTNVIQPQEKQVAPEQKGESDAEKAAKEKALREAELREQERQRAEQAARQKSEQESAAEKVGAGLEFIYFDYDQYAIKPEARSTLNKIADKMKAAPGLTILIEGNCDERGTVEYNIALGERRANAAMKYLTDLGINMSRISTLSNGKEKPVDPGHDEAAWGKNRNAHFLMKK